MNTLQICPPDLSDAATLPWEIQKSHFATLLFIYCRLFTLSQKKTNTNYCSAALAVTYYCLVLPIICIAMVLRLRHATGGAHVLIWTYWGLRQLLNLFVATWAEFRHSVVYYATEHCRKRLEACINAEGGHSEHLLWHCLPDIPVATHHNRFSSEPPMTAHNWLSSEPPTFERTQETFSQMKKFCSSQVSVVTFSGEVGKWITVFWDNVNNHKYLWITLLKVTWNGSAPVSVQ